MPPAAIFLHSSWRSASTYVWSKFRSQRNTLCYYEPLNENLAVMTAEMANKSLPWLFSGHPILDRPYYEEYRSLLMAEGGISDFPLSYIYKNYFLNRDDPAPPLQAHFGRLQAEARRQGNTPVFGMVRSTHRLAWFRRHCPGVHVFVYRDPRRQFVSYLHQATRGNVYFLLRPWVILENNCGAPAVAPLCALLGCPAADAPVEERAAFWSERGRTLNLTELYILFYTLHRIAMRDVPAACDMVIDVGAMGGDPGVIARTEREIAERTGFSLSFADCRPVVGDDRMEWPAEQFAALESLVENLLAIGPGPSSPSSTAPISTATTAFGALPTTMHLQP